MCSVMSGAVGIGSSASTEPITAMIPSGRLSTTPSWAVINVGLPHPISITGPNTVLPSRSGKYSSISAISSAESPTGSSGNSSASITPVRSAGERFGVHRAVEGDEAADAVEREPEPEGDAGERGREAGEQRPAVGVARQLRVDDDDGVDADADEVERQPTRVAPDLRFEGDEPAAAGGLGGELEADVTRRQEVERGSEAGEAVAGRVVGEHDTGADLVHGCRERPDGELGSDRQSELEAGVAAAHVRRQRRHVQRSELSLDRDHDFQSEAARHRDARLAAQADAAGDVDGRHGVADERPDEVVGPAEVDHDRQSVTESCPRNPTARSSAHRSSDRGRARARRARYACPRPSRPAATARRETH